MPQAVITHIATLSVPPDSLYRAKAMIESSGADWSDIESSAEQIGAAIVNIAKPIVANRPNWREIMAAALYLQLECLTAQRPQNTLSTAVNLSELKAAHRAQ